MTVKGQKDLIAKFQQLSKVMQGKAIESALMAGALIIQNSAVQKCPVKTGNLKRSITIRIEKDRAYIGTNVEYAARVEFGFSNADSRGRKYNQPARPYLRPAFDENKDRAKQEVAEALWSIIKNV